MSNPNNTSTGWQEYFDSIHDGEAEDLTAKLQIQLIEKESHRLFSDQGEIEEWQSSGSEEDPQKSEYRPTQRIDFERNHMFFIHQRSSWAHLQVSVDHFQKLLTTLAVSPIFLDCIHCFGAKVTGEDNPFYTYCSHRLPKSFAPLGQVENGYYEFSYLIRHFERHGRSNLKDPWSLRQMAVYQKHSLVKRTSAWIIIQPFQSHKASLVKRFPNSSDCGNPMSLHIWILILSSVNWRWYLNDLKQLLFTFKEKAVYSSLRSEDADYDTSFKDNQRLQLIQDKLIVAREILASNFQIAQSIRRHCKQLHHLNREHKTDPYSAFLTSIDDQAQQLVAFKRTASALIEQARNISTLLSKFLEHKNTGLLNANAEILKSLVSATNAQCNGILDLAEKTRADSQAVKTSTLIAILYLPASLLASIFSSNLVQIPVASNSGSATMLHVSKSVWIYVLLTLSLTAVTLSTFALLDRYTLRSLVSWVRRYIV